MAADKQAIGFVSFAFTAGVNAVGYEGVACNLRNAKSGQYGGVRNFWMVTKVAAERRSAEVHQMGHKRQHDRPNRSSARAGSQSTRAGSAGAPPTDAPRAPQSATDRRAELMLGALAVGVLLLIGLMVVTVVINAWPSFSRERPRLVRIGRERRRTVPRDAGRHRAARTFDPLFPRMAADLGDGPDDRAVGRVRGDRSRPLPRSS